MPTPKRPERRAYVCPKCAEQGTPMRRFLSPDDPGDLRCPTHRIKLVRQPNRPYVRP